MSDGVSDGVSEFDFCVELMVVCSVKGSSQFEVSESSMSLCR